MMYFGALPALATVVSRMRQMSDALGAPAEHLETHHSAREMVHDGGDMPAEGPQNRPRHGSAGHHWSPPIGTTVMSMFQTSFGERAETGPEQKATRTRDSSRGLMR